MFCNHKEIKIDKVFALCGPLCEFVWACDNRKQIKLAAPGGGQVVSMLAFYSDDQSSNPAEAVQFFL